MAAARLSPSAVALLAVIALVLTQQQVGAARLGSGGDSLLLSVPAVGAGRGLLQDWSIPEYIISTTSYTKTGSCPEDYTPTDVCADPTCDEWQCVDSEEVPAVLEKQCVNYEETCSEVSEYCSKYARVCTDYYEDCISGSYIKSAKKDTGRKQYEILKALDFPDDDDDLEFLCSSSSTQCVDYSVTCSSTAEFTACSFDDGQVVCGEFDSTLELCTSTSTSCEKELATCNSYFTRCIDQWVCKSFADRCVKTKKYCAGTLSRTCTEYELKVVDYSNTCKAQICASRSGPGPCTQTETQCVYGSQDGVDMSLFDYVAA